MACQCVPRVVLHEVFRQAKDGSGAEHIALDSHRVNHGALPRHSRSSLLARRTSSSSSGSNGVSSSKDYDDEEGNGKMCSGGSLHAPNGVVQLSSNSASEAADQVGFDTLYSCRLRSPYRCFLYLLHAYHFGLRASNPDTFSLFTSLGYLHVRKGVGRNRNSGCSGWPCARRHSGNNSTLFFFGRLHAHLHGARVRSFCSLIAFINEYVCSCYASDMFGLFTT